MRIYISGKISGEKNYRKLFKKAEKRLKKLGAEVINPASIGDKLPNIDYEEYMAIDLLMLGMCDAIYMLSNWRDSPGAHREWCYARDNGINIFYEKYLR